MFTFPPDSYCFITDVKFVVLCIVKCYRYRSMIKITHIFHDKWCLIVDKTYQGSIWTAVFTSKRFPPNSWGLDEIRQTLTFKTHVCKMKSIELASKTMGIRWNLPSTYFQKPWGLDEIHQIPPLKPWWLDEIHQIFPPKPCKLNEILPTPTKPWGLDEIHHTLTSKTIKIIWNSPNTHIQNHVG